MVWSFLLVFISFSALLFLISDINYKRYENYLEECVRENKKPMSFEQWWNEQHWND